MAHPFNDARHGDVQQFERRLAEAGLTGSMMEAISERPELARGWVGNLTQRLSGGEAQIASRLMVDRFSSPLAQAYSLSEWNAQLGLGLDEEKIAGMAATVPVHVWNNPLRPLVLHFTRSTFLESIDACLAVWRLVYGEDKVILGDLFQRHYQQLEQVPGAPEFKPNVLEWVIPDLGANRDKAPRDVPAATAAGLEVFSTVCHHPVYVSQQDGGDTPYLGAPALRVKVPGHGEFYSPYVYGTSGGQVEIGLSSAGRAEPYCAGPEVLREP